MANNPDVVIGTVLLLLLTLFLIRAHRAGRPDPEMARLLRLLNHMPSNEEAAGEGMHTPEESGHSHSPLGPSSFSLLTSSGAGHDDEHASSNHSSEVERRDPGSASRPKVV
jgi:hypothetical protein